MALRSGSLSFDLSDLAGCVIHLSDESSPTLTNDRCGCSFISRRGTLRVLSSRSTDLGVSACSDALPALSRLTLTLLSLSPNVPLSLSLSFSFQTTWKPSTTPMTSSSARPLVWPSWLGSWTWRVPSRPWCCGRRQLPTRMALSPLAWPRRRRPARTRGLRRRVPRRVSPGSLSLGPFNRWTQRTTPLCGITHQ